jgi:hypothetical protein
MPKMRCQNFIYEKGIKYEMYILILTTYNVKMVNLESELLKLWSTLLKVKS